MNLEVRDYGENVIAKFDGNRNKYVALFGNLAALSDVSDAVKSYHFNKMKLMMKQRLYYYW